MEHQLNYQTALCILLVCLALVMVSPASAIVISDIVVSNHSSNSVTISWITDVVTNGTVNFGTTTALGSSASDTRPNDDTHWVKITGLAPETTYFFEVVSGGVTDDNGGSKYQFKTTKVGTGTTYTVFGFVKKSDEVTPAAGAIVYLTLTHGVESYSLSTLVDSNGAWTLDLGNLKNPTTNDVISPSIGDLIKKRAQGAADGATGWHEFTYTGSSPQRLEPDQSLPVELSNFTALALEGGVRLEWTTQSETNNLGFNVYRSETPNGTFEKINAILIKGAGTDATPHDYQFVDEKIEPGKVYYYYLEDVDFKGITKKSDLLQVDLVTNQSRLQGRPLMPVTTRLLQNFPNPFNPETWIPYQLAKDASVTLTIYDTTGAVVQTISVGHKPAAIYESKDKAIYWDGRNHFGERVASGVYFYTLTAKDFTATRKMLILK